ncbi:MAG: Unknown protein, partial [uncultured Sulfurovum sp.]
EAIFYNGESKEEYTAILEQSIKSS